MQRLNLRPSVAEIGRAEDHTPQPTGDYCLFPGGAAASACGLVSSGVGTFASPRVIFRQTHPDGRRARLIAAAIEAAVQAIPFQHRPSRQQQTPGENEHLARSLAQSPTPYFPDSRDERLRRPMKIPTLSDPLREPGARTAMLPLPPRFRETAFFLWNGGHTFNSNPLSLK